MIIAVVTGCFFFIAHSMETIGYLYRILGKWNLRPTLGYSFHVRTATLGRSFILLGLPLLGYIGDRYKKVGLIVTGYQSFCVIYLLFIVFLVLFKTKIIQKLTTTNFSETYRIKPENNLAIIVVSMFIFLLTFSSVFLVNYYSLTAPGYKGTILQSAGFLSSIGTLANVFYLDKILSDYADNIEYNLGGLILNIYYGRGGACLIGLLASFIL